MEKIELRGVEQLSDAEKFELEKLVEGYKEKIRWKTKTDYVLKLVIKKYLKGKEDKKDAKARYSLSAEITGESQFFAASSEGWDFNKAVHQIFEKLIVEIEHKYHSSEQRNGQKR